MRGNRCTLVWPGRTRNLTLVVLSIRPRHTRLLILVFGTPLSKAPTILLLVFLFLVYLVPCLATVSRDDTSIYCRFITAAARLPVLTVHKGAGA